MAEIGCEVIRKIPRISVIQNVWEILYPILLNFLNFLTVHSLLSSHPPPAPPRKKRGTKSAFMCVLERFSA
jgi:hypothetical protein